MDEKIRHRIIQVVGEPGNPPGFVLLQRQQMIARTNLALLRILLTEQEKKGIFIAIGQPHHCMRHLLETHGIDFSSLHFVDAVSGFAGEARHACAGVTFVAGPFKPKPFFGLESSAYNADDQPVARLDLGEMDFAVMDNVAAVATYNSIARTREFLASHLTVMGRFGIRSFMALDDKSAGDVLALLSKFGSRMVHLKEGQDPDAFVERPDVAPLSKMAPDVNLAVEENGQRIAPTHEIDLPPRRPEASDEEGLSSFVKGMLLGKAIVLPRRKEVGV